LARASLLAYLLVACVLPLIALAVVSLQGFWSGRFAGVALDLENYRTVFGAGTETLAALRNSVLLGVTCAFAGMAIAVLLAYRIGEGGRLGRVVDAVSKIPGTMSHVVVAIAFVGALAGPPLNLEGTVVMLLLAYFVLYLTQATVSAQAAHAMVGRDLGEASRIAGAGPGTTLRRIGIPLMAPGLAAGWAFLFVLVVGDITASAILASPSSPVIGFEILSIFQNGTYPLLAALGTVISLVSTVIVLSALAYAGRRRRDLAERA
jgi:iron(III) transport system permease protein